METITQNQQITYRSVGQMLINNLHRTIKLCVLSYAPTARVFVFGIGERNYGSPIDIYIADKSLSKTDLEKIQFDLITRFNISEITAVYLLQSNEHISRISRIATEI